MSIWYTWQLLASLQTNVRELRKQKLVLKYPEVEENHGDRKEPVMQDRVQQELHSGQAVELYSLQHQEITTIKLNKKEKRAALKSALTSRVQENKFIVVDELSFG